MYKKTNYLLSCFFALSSLLSHAQFANKSFASNRIIDSVLEAFEILSSSTNLDDPDRNNTDSIKINILQTLSPQYSNSESAYQCVISALVIAKRTKNKRLLSIANRKIGNFYFSQALFDKAVKYYLVALKIAEDANDKINIASSLNNLGNVYEHMAGLFNAKIDYEKSLEFHLRALDIRKEADTSEIANSMINISNSYHGLGQDEKATDYLLMVIDKFTKRNQPNATELARTNLGEIYLDMYKKTGKTDYVIKAEKQFSFLFSIYKNKEDSSRKADVLIGMGQIRLLQNHLNEAINYLAEGVKIAKKKSYNDELRNGASLLAEAYNAKEDYKQALAFHKIFVDISDTILNQQSNTQIAEMSAQYKSEKNDRNIELLTKDTALQGIALNKQKFIRNGVIIGLGLALLLALLLYNRFQLKQKLNTTLSNTNRELIQKNFIIEKQKEKIIDSIDYAKLIQQSILTEETEIQKHLPNSFIYYQPKDIVSGDFYWYSKVNDKIIIAAIDCTGHGVPGAFMSMIGNTLLNQIINEKKITIPSEILRLLNIGIFEALHQGKEETLSKDGMDMSICTIDYKTNQLEYAGAENPLYIVSNNELTTIAADRQAVGGRSISKKLDTLKRKYTNHVIPIEKNMNIYLFSDGYMDQFGTSERKKFGIQKFKDLLLNIKHLDMQKQKQLITAAHDNWKGNTQQIDDILIVGISI